MSLPKLKFMDAEPGLFEVRIEPPVPVSKPVPKAPTQAAIAPTAARKIEKSSTAHRTISEVAEELDVPQHVLRFWETKFAQLRPLKRGGGRRYYRTEDVTLIRQIHSLLYGQGYTIKGAQKVLKDKSSPVMAEKPAPAPVSAKIKDESRKILTEMLEELKALRALV